MKEKSRGYLSREYFCKMAGHSIFQKRILILVIIMFFTCYVYLNPVLTMSEQSNVPITLWILPFLYSHSYFMIILFFGAAYVFGNVPFLHQWILYHVMRLGKKRWFFVQLFTMIVQSFFYTATIFGSGFLILWSKLEWTKEWGKIIYSLALTDNSLTTEVYFNVSASVLDRYDPVSFFLLSFFLMVLLVFFMGSLLLFLSLYASRQVAMGVNILCITFIIMEKNILFMNRFIWYSPFSWMNLNRILDGTEINCPPVSYIVTCLLLFSFVFHLLSFARIQQGDIYWNREEI